MPEDAKEGNLEDIEAVVAVLRQHADELRAKGLPIDDMIRDLERRMEEVRALAAKAKALRFEDDLLEKKRAALRGEADRMVTLPPELVDGMSTLLYLKGASERELARRGRPRTGRGS